VPGIELDVVKPSALAIVHITFVGIAAHVCPQAHSLGGVGRVCGINELKSIQAAAAYFQVRQLRRDGNLYPHRIAWTVYNNEAETCARAAPAVRSHADNEHGQ
jgi:hypothetical protein